MGAPPGLVTLDGDGERVVGFFGVPLAGFVGDMIDRLMDIGINGWTEGWIRLMKVDCLNPRGLMMKDVIL